MEQEQNGSPKSGGDARRTRRSGRRADGVVIDPSLLTALGEVPESRAEMVARARRLARDPNYPPEETLRLISEILAAHLEFDGFSF